MRRKVKLKEVCLDVTVGHVGPMADEYLDSGIPFLRSQNILPFRLEDANLKYISEDFHKRLKKSALSPGDVVVVRTGYPGTACVIPHRLPVANCADLVVIHPSDEIDSHYLCCIFNSAWGRSTVSGSLVGVAQQHFNIGVAKEMEITVPPIGTQRRIASILSAYDDLIENNTRRIKILEQITQTLYREWFVNFRFPGHQKVRMLESELGPIPEGWNVERLEAVVEEFIDYRGKTPTKLGGEWSNSGVTALSALNVKQGRLINLEKSKFVSDELYERWMKSKLRAGDVLMTSEAPLGEVYFLPETRRYCLSQRVFAIRSNADVMKPSLLFFFLSSPEGQAELRRRASGTTVLGIRQADLRRIPLVRPDLDVQKNGDLVLRPFLILLDTIQRKNSNLRATRDFLLPKLISGEIPVEAAAELMEATA